MQIIFDGVSLVDDSNGVRVDYPTDIGTPPIRGDNVIIPFRHGSIATPKYYGERSIVLQGFVWGSDRTELWSRIDRIKQAFAVIKGPRRLEFLWPDGTKRYLMAEVRNTMGFQGTHRAFTPFSVELVSADPFWRDDAAAQETPYLLGAEPLMYVDDPEFIIADYDSTYDIVVTSGDETFIINNPGIIPLEDAKLTVTFTYPVSAITLKNLHSGTSFTVTYDFPANSSLMVDCAFYQATVETATSFNDITGSMTTPPGQRAPFIIPIGNSTMHLTQTGSPILTTVALLYAAAYL